MCPNLCLSHSVGGNGDPFPPWGVQPPAAATRWGAAPHCRGGCRGTSRSAENGRGPGWAVKSPKLGMPVDMDGHFPGWSKDVEYFSKKKFHRRKKTNSRKIVQDADDPPTQAHRNTDKKRCLSYKNDRFFFSSNAILGGAVSVKMNLGWEPQAGPVQKKMPKACDK